MACVFAHAVISKRYSKADENTKILYLDANNLYGFGMSGKLPVDDLRWEVEVLIQQALADSTEVPGQGRMWLLSHGIFTFLEKSTN